MWWKLTCASLSCSLVIWSITNLVFMWRHWSVIYLLMNFLQVYIIPYKGHLPPCPPIAIYLFLCWCAVWQKCIPRNVEILQKLWQWHHPMSNVYVSEHVWTMSMLISEIKNVTFTEVQTWHKCQDYSFVLKQTVDVCYHHLLHQLFAELIQHNSSLVNPCLWRNITPMFWE